MVRSATAVAPGEAPTRAFERRERLAAIALALASIAWLSFECRSVRAQIDDAYISYRYAVNLVDGLGLVYNAGEYVEGYTNLLWTLLVAAGLALGGDAERVGHLLGVASGAGLLAATAAFAWASLPVGRRALAGLAPWIVLAHPALVQWSESGMESALFAALATGALACELRGRTTGALVACGFATLTRPEGVLLAAVVLAARWLRDWHAGRPPVAPALAYALLLAALTGFRLLYYGSPLPNTFYAKVTTDVSYRQGLLDVSRFLGQGLFLLLPAVGLSLAADRHGVVGAVWAGLTLVYLIAIGGDTIGPTRFLLPVLPVLAVLALSGVVRGWQRARPLGLTLALLLAAGVGWQVVPSPFGAPAGHPTCLRSRTLEAVRQSRQVARTLAAAKVRRLARIRPRVELVAASGIGYLGYASRLPLIDLLGLTDATIARTPLRESEDALPVAGHRRSNADFVLARRPDYIMIGRHSELLQAHRDLLAHPEFARLYCWDEQVRAYGRCDRMRHGRGPRRRRGSGAALAPGRHERRLRAGGLERSYDLYVPPGYDGRVRVPLLLDYHGLDSNKREQARLSGFDRIADREGFLVARPQGIADSWNSGDCCGEARSQQVDDVAFTRAVVAAIAAEAKIDPRRVYATGLSNGGAMAQVLACQAADLLAAAAPMAFPLPYRPLTDCAPVRPISVLTFMSLTDVLIRYQGGRFPSAAETLAHWRRVDRCPDGDPSERLTRGGSHCEIHAPCAAGVAAGLCSIAARETPGTLYSGHVLYDNDDFELADLAWQFLSRFELPDPTRAQVR